MTRGGEPIWQPLDPQEIIPLLSSVSVPWWIAGGWAIDLSLGATTRTHTDLDVGLLRRDVMGILQRLPDWEVFEACEGRLTRLLPGRSPAVQVNSLWCRRARAQAWSFELMLDEAVGVEWVFRRQREIRRPLQEIIRHTPEGMPYLAPEVQLLYKAGTLRRRDERDFENVLPYLNAPDRRWLAHALERVHPGHRWAALLAERLAGSRSAGP
jgi:hypothetical protein